MSDVNVLVIGAGPAGMAAAKSAQESGARVAMVDDNWSAGGQIWRGVHNSHTRTPAGIQIFYGTQVVARGTGERTLLLEDSEKAFELAFDKLIFATGAREIYLPFPGWTLPGVMGAGGLQALVKSGVEIHGKAVVIAGSGPLLLAVAAYLRKAGAHVKLIAEQAETKAVSSFAFHMVRYPQKVRQAAALKLSLHGVPYLRGCWMEAAEGDGRLQRVRIRQGRKIWMEDCDYAGVGYGLYPNTELATLLGCRLRANAVEVDEWQGTSIADVFAAGECTGIGGVDLSLLEGAIAGYAACSDTARASHLFGKRRSAQRFAEALDCAFRLREELRTLPRPGTIICRCEDVPYERLQQVASFRAAKLHTRCGMGPCQARICGAATEFLFGWRTDSFRPPILPTRAASLINSEKVSTGEFDNTMNKKIEWRGVFPAITTPFNNDLSVDHGFLAEHCKWLVNKGCKGLVAAGSLGEGATLSLAEKDRVIETCVKAVGEQAYVVAGISSLSTAEAVAAARSAEKIGCHGLMVLPPYVYVGDWREMQSHVSAVISATSLSVMLYNNPIAYKTDFLPEQVRELLDRHPNLQAIKESSADVRRVSALRAIAGERLQILCGVDDEIVEAVYAGAVGWIAGLVNAFPQESVDLFELALQGKKSDAFELYSWFLPLLRLDVVPKFVQLIKLVQEEVGMGSQRVRPPRLPLTGQELEDTKRLVADSLKQRPMVRVAAQ